MKRTISITLLLAAVAAVAIPKGAEAADHKIYTAAQCMAADGNEADYSRSEYRITRTGDDGSGTLLCPLIRDVHLNCNAGQACNLGASTEVKVYDHDLYTDVVCTLSARSPTGSAIYYDTDKSYNAPGHDTLSMSVGSPGVKGSYALKCTMGTNNGSNYSKIFSYFVSESQTL